MAFSIDELPFGSYKIIELSHPSGSAIQVIPEYGCCLHYLALRKYGRSFPLLLTSKEYTKFESRLKPMFNGAFLAPFPNRIEKGEFNWQGRKYSFPHNDFGRTNALHGFVFDKCYHLINEDLQAGSVTFIYNYEGNYREFPFPFTIEHRFDLNEANLVVETAVTNKGDASIPFGTGWHPYFHTGTPVSKMQLQAPGNESYLVNSSMIPTGETATLDDFDTLTEIGNTELDTCFKLKEDLNSTTIFDPENDISIKVTQDQHYRFVQYYTPPTRDCLAVEPMTCIPNAFNNGIGLIEVQPGIRSSSSFQIELF